MSALLDLSKQRGKYCEYVYGRGLHFEFSKVNWDAWEWETMWHTHGPRHNLKCMLDVMTCEKYSAYII